MTASIRLGLRLLRAREWVKNLFIFLPIFFGARFTDAPSLWAGVGAFLLFCLLTSSVYLMNDLRDRERDRLHPRKRERPIASGKVGGGFALTLSFVLGILSLSIAFFWNGRLGSWMAAYLLLNIAYTYFLKNLGLVDVFVIALGFVLRLFVGVAATGQELSPWIILMTFLLALFLGFAKRRDDLLLAQGSGTTHRMSTLGYSPAFADGVLILMSGVTLVCYIMYTMDPHVIQKYHQRPLYPSAGFVTFGLLRYLQLALVRNEAGSPTEALWKDRWLQLSILGMVGYFAVILYLPEWLPIRFR